MFKFVLSYKKGNKNFKMHRKEMGKYFEMIFMHMQNKVWETGY